MEDIRIKVLGRKGELTAILRSLGTLSPEEKGIVGKRSNEIKNIIETSINEKKDKLSETSSDQLFTDEWLDVTIEKPDLYFKSKGNIHILYQVQLVSSH